MEGLLWGGPHGFEGTPWGWGDPEAYRPRYGAAGWDMHVGGGGFWDHNWEWQAGEWGVGVGGFGYNDDYYPC